MDALIKIQEALVATKDQYNSFGKYNYRSTESILAALKPLLTENSAYLTLNDEIVEVGGRVYVKATASLTQGDKTVSASAFAREAAEQRGMNEPQITGSSSSYARKYALSGLFCIDDTKDSDATNDHGKGEKLPQEKKSEVPASTQNATDPPAKPPRPQLVTVLEHMRKCSAREPLDQLHTQALTHTWTDAQKKTINDCFMNCCEKFPAKDTGMDAFTSQS